MSKKIINLEDFKNRDKPLEFAWSWDTSTFYSIDSQDIDRILELLSYSNDNITANIRYRN